MTIDEAKKIYKKNGCSLFTMAREDASNYILYKKENINDELEKKWRQEEIEELTNLFKLDRDCKLFNQIYDLAVSFRDIERLNHMMLLVDKVRINNIKESLCVAETIIGRKQLSMRSGMIFWAYDINERGLAYKLVRKAESLVCIDTSEKEDRERVLRNQDKLDKIATELRLNKWSAAKK